MSIARHLYTREQVSELDHIAINQYGISGFMLMQRAAKASFNAMLEYFPESQKIVIGCGTGNNGGDGYLFAALALKDGFDVSVIELGNSDSITGDALLAKKTFEKVGGVFLDTQTSNYTEKIMGADVIVDAIFGTGLDRNIEGEWAKAIQSINQSNAKVVAIDIPSGLDANTGSVLGVCVKADLTVTFIGQKRGLFTGQARDYRGTLLFDDLSIPTDVYSKLKTDAETFLIDNNTLKNTLKPRLRCSHKGDSGHVLLIGGNQGMSGAIKLAGEACLRAGAGLVSIATHPAHADYVNMTRPELMVHAVEETTALVNLIKKADVIAIGPGLGQSDWGLLLFEVAMKSDKPKVLDADALNILANSTIPANNNWILTPHPAEAARLVSSTTKKIEQDRFQSIKKIAKKWGGVITLKGAGSLISDGNTIHICNAGNPGMASGGMGDVLTGIIGALLAQGLSLKKAAMVGVSVHSHAADLAANDGERGLIASDLFPFIRKLVNNLYHE